MKRPTSTVERPAPPWRPDPASAHTPDCQLAATFGGEAFCLIECLQARLGLTVEEALAFPGVTAAREGR